MIPLHAILLLFAFQVIAYILLDKYKFGSWKYLVLAVCLILNFFILPYYFMPDYSESEIRCGMPALGIILGFWILGGGLTIVTHLVYFIIKKINRKKLASLNEK